MRQFCVKKCPGADTLLPQNCAGYKLNDNTTVLNVYENYNERKIGDIDIYIRVEQIELFIKYLAELGYYDINSYEPLKLEKWERYIGASTHLTPFAKNIIHEGKTYTTRIEIHLYPFFVNAQYRLLQTQLIYNTFFESAVVTNLADLRVPMLPPSVQ